jgi:hypothetical protein
MKCKRKSSRAVLEYSKVITKKKRKRGEKLK